MATETRVVLDTNVLVAAAYNPAGASRRTVEACPDGQLTPVLSPPSALVGALAPYSVRQPASASRTLARWRSGLARLVEKTDAR